MQNMRIWEPKGLPGYLTTFVAATIGGLIGWYIGRGSLSGVGVMNFVGPAIFTAVVGYRARRKRSALPYAKDDV